MEVFKSLIHNLIFDLARGVNTLVFESKKISCIFRVYFFTSTSSLLVAMASIKVNIARAFSQPRQTSKRKLFAKIINS